MNYFRDVNHEKIIDMWKKHFDNSEADNKFLLIFVAHEVILQSSKKGNMEYIKGFGDVLIDCFRSVCRKSESLETLSTLIKLCDLWETMLIYANNFMEFLRKIVNSRIKELSSSNNLQELDDKSINDFNLISKFEPTKKLFELDIEEENIK